MRCCGEVEGGLSGYFSPFDLLAHEESLGDLVFWEMGNEDQTTVERAASEL